MHEVLGWLKDMPTPLRHAFFLQAYDALEEVLLSRRMVSFVGPTGVGKSALIKEMARLLNELVASDPSQISAVVVRVETPHGKAFSWKQFWLDVLAALDDPLPERKVDRMGPAAGVGRRTGAHFPSATERQLFDMVRRTAADRGLRVLFIDEALPLFSSMSGRMHSAQLDVLRNLADETEFRVVLTSTPRILPHLQPSGELRRRIGHVYFPRYSETRPDEFLEFCRPVRACLDRLHEFSFRPRPDDLVHLLRGSIGCVGELIEWIGRALSRCIRAGDRKLSWSHFDATVMSDSDIVDLLRECRDGESRHAEDTTRTFGANLNWDDDEVSSLVDGLASPAHSTSSQSKQGGPPSGRIGISKAQRRKVA